jgi:hypothetical protein
MKRGLHLTFSKKTLNFKLDETLTHTHVPKLLRQNTVQGPAADDQRGNCQNPNPKINEKEVRTLFFQ